MRSQKSRMNGPRADSDFHLAQVQMAALVLGCLVSGFAGGVKHAKKKKKSWISLKATWKTWLEFFF